MVPKEIVKKRVEYVPVTRYFSTYLGKLFMVKTSSTIFQPITDIPIPIMRISPKVVASLQAKCFKELTNATVTLSRTHETQGRWKSEFGNTATCTNRMFQIRMLDISYGIHYKRILISINYN